MTILQQTALSKKMLVMHLGFRIEKCGCCNTKIQGITNLPPNLITFQLSRLNYSRESSWQIFKNNWEV